MKNLTRAYTAKKRPRTKGRHLIEFYSKKNNCHVWFASFLERSFGQMLEFEKNVFSYSSQPESFLTGVKKRYTPDLLAASISGNAAYFEVKHHKFLNDYFWERFNAANVFLADRNEPPLKLVTTKDKETDALDCIKIDPIVCKNQSLLYPYLGQQLPLEALVLDNGSRSTSVRELISVILSETPYKSPVDAKRIAYTLIANGHYQADWSVEFSVETSLEQVCHD